MPQEVQPKNSTTSEPFIGPHLISNNAELKAGLIHDFQGVLFDSSKAKALEDHTTLLGTTPDNWIGTMITQANISRKSEQDTEYMTAISNLETALKIVNINSDSIEVSNALNDVRIELFGEEIEASNALKDEKLQKRAIRNIQNIKDLKPAQIAVRPDVISDKTRAYVGKLDMETLRRLHDAGIEIIYTDAEDETHKVEFRDNVLLGQATKEELLIKVLESGMRIDERAVRAISSDSVKVSPNQGNLTLVSLNPGLIGNNLEDVRKCLESLGLDFAPPEVVFNLHELFSMENWDLRDNVVLYLGMEPIGEENGVLYIAKDGKESGFKIGQTKGYVTGNHIDYRARVLFALKPKPNVEQPTDLI